MASVRNRSFQEHKQRGGKEREQEGRGLGGNTGRREEWQVYDNSSLVIVLLTKSRFS